MTDDWRLKLKMLLLYRGSPRLWYREVWKRESGERMCCDGRECGCYGASWGDMWEYILQVRKNRRL